MLNTRTLGSQGLTVSELGLGLMGMTQAYGTSEERDERESIATIHRAVELLGRGAAGPLFVVVAATLLLIGVGIHNAWDTVTYLTLTRLRSLAPESEPTPLRRDVHGTRGRHRR